MENNKENRRFCSACGALLTGTNFCGECGAKVLITAAHTPVPEETIPAAESVPVEEIPVPIAEPVPAAEIPVSITEPAPAVESIPDPVPVMQVAPRPWRFPVAAVILMGIVVLWMVNQTFTDQVFNWTGIVHICCTAAVLAGMIIGRKKRNWIVGSAFLAYACIQIIIYSINMTVQLKSDFNISSILMAVLMGGIYILWYGAFGISYLVARPKIAILKNVMGGLLAGFGLLGTIGLGVSLITAVDKYIFVKSFLQYLLYFTPMGLSVILYTPFKKR